jgi:hypothetical protein
MTGRLIWRPRAFSSAAGGIVSQFDLTRAQLGSRCRGRNWEDTSNVKGN